MSNLLPDRHPSLPKNLTNPQLKDWLERSAVDTFQDEKKRLFEPDEIAEFEHESSANGREMNRLVELLEQAKVHIKKGSLEALKITFPATKGTAKLDEFRRQNDDLIETGYHLESRTIFGIPNAETHEMNYFDEEGNIIEERTRPLSPKEKHTHLALFQNVRTLNKTENVDESTGEITEKEGTND